MVAFIIRPCVWKVFFPQCNDFQKLHICLHLDNTHEIGKTIVFLGKYKFIMYGVKDGKKLKRCELVKNDVCVVDFIKLFHEKKVYEYISHTHRCRWLDK